MNNQITLTHEVVRGLVHSIKNIHTPPVLNVLEQIELMESEVYLGNVIVEDNLLTCILDGKIKKYRLVSRKANKEDIVCILDTEKRPWSFYAGRFFKVSDEAPHYCLTEPCMDYVTISLNDYCGNTYDWQLYENQYIVLDEVGE